MQEAQQACYRPLLSTSCENHFVSNSWFTGIEPTIDQPSGTVSTFKNPSKATRARRWERLIG